MTTVADDAPRRPPEPDAAPDDDAASTRQLPRDEAAEAAVLGACLLSADAADRAITLGLTPADFHAPRHELIYSVMVAMFAAGEAIDPITLADRLATRGDLPRVGGPAYLHTLLAATPTAANVEYYVRIVVDKATLRRLVTAGSQVMRLGYAPDGGTVDDAVAAAQTEILAVTDRTQARDPGIAAGIDDVIDRIDQGVSAAGTPWREINDLIGGWVAGSLYVVGGYVGHGKSIFGLQAAVDMTRRHARPAVYCSLEMTRDQLTARVIAQLGLVDLGRLNRGGRALEERDWLGVRRAHRIITNADQGDPLPLDLYDQAGQTLADIRAHARESSRLHRRPPGLVVVDFVQLMRTASRRSESRQVEVAEFAYGLKELAKTLGVPVLALCQLNRGPDTARRKPRLSDLRESGAIEQAADAVVLLSREDGDDGTPGEFATADVAKNRQGPTGEVTLRWEGRYSRLLDPNRDDEGAVAA